MFWTFDCIARPDVLLSVVERYRIRFWAVTSIHDDFHSVSVVDWFPNILFRIWKRYVLVFFLILPSIDLIWVVRGMLLYLTWWKDLQMALTTWKTNWIWILYKDVVLTSQITQGTSVGTITRLVLCREVVGIYCEDHTNWVAWRIVRYS